jgi:hypothetical protein
MIDRATPPLALALAAAAASRLHLEERETAFRESFVPAIGALDEADREYRRTIGEVLPPQSAGSLLAAMATFRERVHEIRERTRRELGELYRRYGRSYGSFDPLSPNAPFAHGVSHADGTRVATIADGARSQVDKLRGDVNESAIKGLERSAIDALIVAKRGRRAAFETALAVALQAAIANGAAATSSEFDKALYELTQLADSWY